jgi:hypothetical protein
VKKPKKIQTPKEQAAAFRKAARELGADESDDRFKDVLRTLAKAKPEPHPKKGKTG